MTFPTRIMGAETGGGAGLKGTGLRQVATFTPAQQELFGRLFGYVAPEGYLSRLAGGSPEAFEAIEGPARRQFSEFQGNIASRFSGVGSDPRIGSARRSSGFQNVMNQGAANFAEQLMANRMNLQRQALQDLRGMSSELLGLQPYAWQKEPRSTWENALSIGAPIVGGLLGSFGGPMGSIAGATLGHQLASGYLGEQSQAPNWAGISQLPRSWKF